VFKGGNALDFAWQPNRSTLDLDFSFDESANRFTADVDTIRRLLEQGFRVVSSSHGVSFRVNSVRQQPSGEDKTFITYSARVGYGLPDETQLLLRMANRQPSPHVIPIDISINEPICGSTTLLLDDDRAQLRISTLEDIVSEKLRALLQQPVRNRNRRQDVLDIAVIIHNHLELDRGQIGAYLLIKAAARGIAASKGGFRDREVAARANVDYDALAATTRSIFIPFDEAFATVLALVDELPIPAE
jgi:predicted nucleotidyltransferase component of viral defense system